MFEISANSKTLQPFAAAPAASEGRGSVARLAELLNNKVQLVTQNVVSVAVIIILVVLLVIPDLGMSLL